MLDYHFKRLVASVSACTVKFKPFSLAPVKEGNCSLNLSISSARHRAQIFRSNPLIEPTISTHPMIASTTPFKRTFELPDSDLISHSLECNESASHHMAKPLLFYSHGVSETVIKGNKWRYRDSEILNYFEENSNNLEYPLNVHP